MGSGQDEKYIHIYLEVDGVALPEMEEGVTDEHAEEDDAFGDVKWVVLAWWSGLFRSDGLRGNEAAIV